MFKNTTSDTSLQHGAARGGARRGREEHRGVPAMRSGGVPLSTAHIRPFFEYAAGASLLTASKGIEGVAVGGGKRSGISGFSRASRLRLMRTIAKIRKDAELPCFVTLTYPDRFPSPAEAKRDLNAFLRRFHRAWPGAGLIWKLEPQERGAPHYHLLVWGVGELDLLVWVVNAWYKIAGQGDENHRLFHGGLLRGSVPCVSKVRSFRGVWFYAAKYLGKTFEVAGWSSLWTGRYWGVRWPANIPFGEVRRVLLTPHQVIRLMRYQRRFSKQRARRYCSNTLTVFCDADQWVTRMSELLVPG